MAPKRQSPGSDDDNDQKTDFKRMKSSTKEDEEPYWDLNASGTRKITITEFKGKTMVGIREYYEKDGAKLPGKKVRRNCDVVLELWSEFWG